MTHLSKSRIMSSIQCLKRVHLEVHFPELAVVSPTTQAAFATGHAVGDIAVQAYGAAEGIYIDYHGGLGTALRTTGELLAEGIRVPVFEATLEHDGVLIREDVLLPTPEGLRVVEIKASTSVKDPHRQDCAIQAWVHTGAGYPLDSISLGHVDSGFVYAGDGDYAGMLTEQDLTREAADLAPSVPLWVERARRAVDGPIPEVPVGQHCFSPYECPFIAHCWPMDCEYPVHGLRGSRKRLGELVAAGYRDIRDVPPSKLRGELQERISRVTRAGRAEVLPAAGAFVRQLDYPRYYLDFETVAPAVPVWKGTRPYEVLPFQYSCHVEQRDGTLGQREFLNLSGQPPMRGLAERLIADLGDRGPVLMYTAYEKGILAGLAQRYPDLSSPLRAIMDRLVDLYPVTKQNYYHPAMLGSWSIKAVLPTIAPDMDYARLGGVSEGNEASAAYLEAIGGHAEPERIEAIREELLTYCRHDTLAMVRLAQFFAEH